MRKQNLFPDVPLETHDGKRVRFYRDLVKDRIVVINMMYALCKGSCPGSTANLLKLQQRLGPVVGRDVFMYSFTLQPERDTAAELKAYAERHNVRPGWRFLTGAPTHIETLRRALGFVNADPALDADRSNHIGLVLFGNDARDRWAGHPIRASVDSLVSMVEAIAFPRKVVPT